MTLGEMLFYGGIAGVALFTILFLTCWGIFERKKKRLMQKIDKEYMNM